MLSIVCATDGVIASRCARLAWIFVACGAAANWGAGVGAEVESSRASSFVVFQALHPAVMRARIAARRAAGAGFIQSFLDRINLRFVCNLAQRRPNGNLMANTCFTAGFRGQSRFLFRNQSENEAK